MIGGGETAYISRSDGKVFSAFEGEIKEYKDFDDFDHAVIVYRING